MLKCTYTKLKWKGTTAMSLKVLAVLFGLLSLMITRANATDVDATASLREQISHEFDDSRYLRFRHVSPAFDNKGYYDRSSDMFIVCGQVAAADKQDSNAEYKSFVARKSFRGTTWKIKYLMTPDEHGQALYELAFMTYGYECPAIAELVRKS